ncbi:hypothetical protein KKB69_00835 [Patescibacteria group bacterium]|nr:hypothetical protein [Patescibacteria group bacterium]
MKYIYVIFGVLLAPLLIAFNPDSAYAGIGLGIQPNKISHTIEPGNSVSGVIILKNASDSDVKVDVEVNDFIPTPGTGDFHFVKRAEGVTSVRDWVTIGSPADFIFKQGESREIPYTIKAPQNAEPGSHFGVAFFMASKIADTGQLKIGTRVAMVIYVTVPGNFLQKGKILGFTAPKFIQKGPINFKIKFENVGTVHFEPKGAIKITNILGKEVAEAPVSGQLVLPTGVRDLTAQWKPEGFLVGRYKATIEIKDGEGNVLTANTITFYVFPLWYILGFFGAIAVVFFGLKFIKSKFSFNIARK